VPAIRAALLGIALLAIAALFDAEPLYVAGASLVLIAAAAATWVLLAARGAWVDRELMTRQVEEEAPLQARIAVRAGALPFPGGAIREPLLGREARLPTGEAQRVVRVRASFSRRGRRTVEPTQVVIRDPLGLMERTVTGPSGDEILILPRTYPVIAQPPWGAEREGRARSPLAAPEVEIDGVRPYQHGTPASRIHWPSVARGYELMERRLRSDLDAMPLVALDSRAPADLAQLDEAVRAAASLVLHLARAGGCALLLPGDRRATTIDRDLVAWPAAHARLAVVEPGGTPSPTALGPRGGAVIYVTARPGAEPPAMRRGVGGERIVVVPGGGLPGRPVFEVGSCRGYRLGRAVRAAGAA
jgi:uncharacterized protein (DUF58 family)